MESKAHSQEVQRKHIERDKNSPYRCDNCSETFTSESERRKHEEEAHGRTAEPKK